MILSLNVILLHMANKHVILSTLADRMKMTCNRGNAHAERYFVQRTFLTMTAATGKFFDLFTHLRWLNKLHSISTFS